jgi:uncharacterized protein
MDIERLAIAAVLLCGAQRAWAVEIPGNGGARFTVPVASIKEIRFRTTLRQQYDFSCGSAAVATLLTHHYGQAVSEQDVFQQMFERGNQDKIRKEGFSLLDMKLFLAARGFQADGFKLPLQKLVDAKLPAIVLVSENGYHHVIVIKGAAGAARQSATRLKAGAWLAPWITNNSLLVQICSNAVRVSERVPLAGSPTRTRPPAAPLMTMKW